MANASLLWAEGSKKPIDTSHRKPFSVIVSFARANFYILV